MDLIGHAQVVINEVCSKNNTVITDAFGHTPDWIELHNTGNTPVQLDQYHLSDRPNGTGLWQLPSFELSPGGYTVFFASHSESGEGHFTFGISQAGEGVFLYSADMGVAHSMVVPALHGDHSYGHWNGEQRIFAEPTPGGPNSTEGFMGYAIRPWTNIPPGRVSQGATLLLWSDPGATIHVTLDGSDPDTTSPNYSGSLSIPNTMVVKAISVKPGMRPSEVLTATYFVGEPLDLPMVSISVHPDSLFHEEHGLYVPGPGADSLHPYLGANFWSNRHIPVRFEFFNELGQQGFVQQVDLRMHGGTQARTKPQRSLRLTARGRYGANVMDHPFFPERGLMTRHKHLVLRNSGGDFCLANFRDGLWHQTTLHNKIDIDALAFRPVSVFINGVYWGIMNLREMNARQYLGHHNGIDPDEVLLMENENIPREGDSIHFALLRDHILNNDMNDPTQFQYVADRLDIPSFKDYFALEIFAGNADWPANNVRYWKPSVDSGKWRYLLQDLDATMNIFGWIPMDFDAFSWVLIHREGWTHSEIFRSFLANGEFRLTFLNRLADLMNTALSHGEFQHEVDLIVDYLAPQVDRHYDRWGCALSTFNWHALDLIPEFARTRAGHVREHVLQTFDLPHTVDLTFETFPPGAGGITLNSIQPALPFKGVYFHGNAIDLSAHPASDFKFDHWEWTGQPFENWTSEVIRKDFDENGTITAYFKQNGIRLSAFPIPCEDEVFLSIEGEFGEVLDISLHDPQGRELHRLRRELSQGVNKIRMDMSTYASGVFLVNARSAQRNESIRIIRNR